ncbi:polysaccharide biosynthesis protein [Fluviicola taffensis]|uniref:Polysaccharide biosynthesis protein CapD n=1 Tax=Fluviicola taffensis (strain DSM 16823 / NCIMB 13979 / RW262) TaxID=755732 RepID=F2IHP1_FLUTR|nr:nucleoside-diphosphate sugar epimerase/dehydratase [Fluviicola taffensis]AEA44819.1 polysaccharide biosynthesis protein CapD [Fluviicola taffensis DSM 16823]
MFPKKNIPRWIIILIDLFISAVSLLIAYLIRFDIKANASKWKSELEIVEYSIIVFFLVRLIVFLSFGIQKGIVRHTSTSDFKRLFLATTTSSFIFILLGFVRFYWFDHYYLFPISILIIEYVFCFFFLSVSRFVVKLLYMESVKSTTEQQFVLIYGAGISGLIAKRMIEKDVRIHLKVFGFIDDNKRISGNRIEGVEVFHTSKLDEILLKNKIHQVIIAIQNLEPERRNWIIETGLNAGVEVKKVPSPKSWINGSFTSKQISQVNIEDLLGRTPIILNQDKLAESLENQVVLITGAAGSIGSGIVRQVLEFKPKLVVLLDQAESALYDLEFELKQLKGISPFEVVVGDICNEERMNCLFETFKPSWVFHAAAYKHVPMMELNPSEAVRNNVKGTKILVDLSNSKQVHKFVMISTDKAVNPTNVMGASKRIAEIIAQAANKGQTQFITTRFGNVLGSNGSVIPLFKRQIEQGGPITVTDERITRYFMTIPEACQLVLEAGVMGSGGEIFVFDMGKSVRIVDLAKKMILLSGLELGKDIEIRYSGLRPGEKLYEELLNDEENVQETHHPKILIATERGLDDQIMTEIHLLLDAIGEKDNLTLVKQMKVIVPEFLSNNSEYSVLDKK